MPLFEAEIDTLRVYDERVHKWLVDSTSPLYWSRSHFRTNLKCDIFLNNLCESFNSMILDAREETIPQILENNRIYLMERLQTKREWMKKWSDEI